MADNIYETACIYKLESTDGSKVYYGSTKDFKHRMIAHKSAYKRYLNGTFHYMTSFDIIKDPGYTCSIIEEFTKITKRDLESKESEYIQNNDCINKMKLLTDQEKNENMKQAKEKWYKNNKSKINQDRNQKFSCACGGHFTKRNKYQHKESKKHQKYLQSLQPIVQNITNNITTSSGINITIK